MSGSMSAPASSTKALRRRFWRPLAGWTVFLVLVVGGWAAWQHPPFAGPPANASTPPPTPLVSVCPTLPDAVTVSLDLVKSMHADWTEAQSSPSTLPLRLSGLLMLDPSRLVHVQSRFVGEVISVGDDVSGSSPDSDEPLHPLQVGDRVIRGQVLAVIWSKEVGEKKSDLVDALSNLWLHEALLKKLRMAGEGTVAQRAIDEMQRTYESDLILVTRVRRTLRSWRIDEEELLEIEHEAQRIHQAAQRRDDTPATSEQLANTPRDQRWAEIEIRAPRDGLILEKNFTVGDFVDTTIDLFKIADLSRLGVLANVYEDDLPRLLALAPAERRWELTLPSQPQSPASMGRIEMIGHVIDPNQHTAVVKGWVENPHEQLRVGQFARATVAMPRENPSITVPLSAVVDLGERSCVLVVHPGDEPRFQRRWVTVVRRTANEAWLSPAATAPSKEPVAVGDPVVFSGAIELHAKLVELLAALPADHR